MTTAALEQMAVPEVSEALQFPEAIKEQVSAYLRTLGLRDPALIKAVTGACLQRASRRAAPGAHHELLRRALEEAQRRFDGALGQALNLQGSKSPHALAAARAVLLLEDTEVDADALMRGQQDLSGVTSSICSRLPQATPPESRLPMHEQPLSFFFSRSSHSRN